MSSSEKRKVREWTALVKRIELISVAHGILYCFIKVYKSFVVIVKYALRWYINFKNQKLILYLALYRGDNFLLKIFYLHYGGLPQHMTLNSIKKHS